MDAWLIKNNKSELRENASTYYTAILKAGLIPRKPNSYKTYDKAVWHFAVACAESGLPQSEVKGRLKAAEKIMLLALRLLVIINCCANVGF